MKGLHLCQGRVHGGGGRGGVHPPVQISGGGGDAPPFPPPPPPKVKPPSPHVYNLTYRGIGHDVFLVALDEDVEERNLPPVRGLKQLPCIKDDS